MNEKSNEQRNAEEYEQMYKQGYGLVYPDGHLIRIHRQILEWELKMKGGKIFDFGCGSGAHLKYFADHGYEPHGCDTSATAIEQCKRLMSKHAGNFFVNDVMPDLPSRYAKGSFDIFLSNQVLYYLDDAGIRKIAKQASEILRPGGVFVVSLMPRSCWYAQHVTEEKGEFSKVVLRTPRLNSETYINFSEPGEWSSLFQPFQKLHIGSYSWLIREDEGAHVHWTFVGISK